MANEHLLVGKWWRSGCSATSEHLRPRKENYVLFIQEPLLIIENGFAMLLAFWLGMQVFYTVVSLLLKRVAAPYQKFMILKKAFYYDAK